MQNPLTPFFNPRGVAIIGASSNPNKLSYGIFKNLLQYGYQGKIYPVNPNAKEISGLTCYPDVTSVPDPVDLAVSVVPSGMTPDVLEACGQRGIKAVTIISGGFREVGPEGIALEDRCVQIARHYQMRLIGPNCVGTMDLHSGLDTTFIYGVPDKGSIGFLSQSGAICGGIVDLVKSKQIGFSNFVSLGNMADVTETDMIEYLATDPNTKVITLYVEGIQDGTKFLETARRVSREKPLVILKAGKTQAGAKAVSSHTGSIAGSHAAYKAAFLQSGVIEVDTVAELFDVALALSLQPIAEGEHTVIITNSGGPAALASDSLAVNGMKLSVLDDETITDLRQHLNPSAQVNNPVDMLGGAEPADYGTILERVLADTNVDAVVPILVPQALVNPTEVAREIVRASRNTHKPIIACFMGDQAVVEARRVLHAGGIPMYVYPETTGQVLGMMRKHGAWKSAEIGNVDTVADRKLKMSPASLASFKGRTHLGEAETRPLLDAYGIPLVKGMLVRSAEEAGRAASQLGGKLVLKIVSPDLLHKSDAGGIRLGVRSGDIQKEYVKMVADLSQNIPTAQIEGAMVEVMAERGQEVIVGIRRDPSFGPLLMFGLGGIYVELFSDVSFRVAPVTRLEARKMILETRAGKLLSGYRGAAPADLESVVDVIIRLGQLALDAPELYEIEINPLVVYPEGKGVLALDCRAILKE